MKYTSRKPTHTSNSSAYVNLATTPARLKTTMNSEATPRPTALNVNQRVGDRRLPSDIESQPMLHLMLKTVFPNELGWLGDGSHRAQVEYSRCLPTTPDDNQH